MKIELKEITIKDLIKGYQDDGEGGVVGFDGKLDIRPPFQREFVYHDKQRDAVINTIRKGFPLNVMYWAVKNDGNFEIIDGQQRTISIGQYIAEVFSFQDLYFYNLQPDQREQILNYELMIYQCNGTDSEKLDWFKTINIAGEELTNQELRNAVYAGSWTIDAKRYFSKTKCPAYRRGKDYIKGTPIRQDYLETAIKWISKNKIEKYMGQHQHDPDAKKLSTYFESVIEWVEKTFVSGEKDKRKQMQGVDWGKLYNEHKDTNLDPKNIQHKVTELMKDENDQITNLRGIYAYVLDGNEKHLNLRAFKDSDKQKAYERQKGKCAISRKEAPITEMEADHITPWSKGGKTDLDNCQMVLREYNREKSDK